jgi:peptidylprolyl isomerase
LVIGCVDTKHGRIVIKLRSDVAPKHVERIKQLAREGSYDNVPIYWRMPGFAQTDAAARGDGYANLPAEFSNVPFRRGTAGCCGTRTIRTRQLAIFHHV